MKALTVFFLCSFEVRSLRIGMLRTRESTPEIAMARVVGGRATSPVEVLNFVEDSSTALQATELMVRARVEGATKVVSENMRITERTKREMQKSMEGSRSSPFLFAIEIKVLMKISKC